jgi:hypothetical protein
MDALFDTYGIARNRTYVKGHREVGTTSTTCPGNTLFSMLQALIDRSSGIASAPPAPLPAAQCSSQTVGHSVDDGACVQVVYEACGLDNCAWYLCNDGAWQCADAASCAADVYAHAQCASTPTPEPTPSPSPAPTTGSYSDLSSEHWAFAAAELLRDEGALWGCATGLFCPDQLITRAEVAYLLAALINTPVSVPASAVFTDVDGADWYYDAVQEVASRGITFGCGDGTAFCPESSSSRAAAAVFVRRAFALASSTAASSSFVDVAADHWAFGAIEAAYGAGYTQGCAATPLKYCPDDMMTRAEAAVFFARAFELIP